MQKTTFHMNQHKARPKGWQTDEMPVAQQSGDLVPATPTWLEPLFDWFFNTFNVTHRRLAIHHSKCQQIGLSTDLRIQKARGERQFQRAVLDEDALTEIKRTQNQLGLEVERFKNSLQARVAMTARYEEIFDQIEAMEFDPELLADLVEDAEFFYQQQREKMRQRS